MIWPPDQPSDPYILNRLLIRTPYVVKDVSSYDYGNYLILHVENLKNRQTYCRHEIFCRIIKEFFGLDIGKYFTIKRGTELL